MILHTVNKSPSAHSTLKECLFSAQCGDSILLIEDGVYGATAAFAPLMRDDLKYFVLKDDLIARGLTPEALANIWTSVSYSGFVELTESADSVCSWF